VARKIRQLAADLGRAGFYADSRRQGNHREFVHPKFLGFVLISGHNGDDARHYQEK
jgi:predicted RNA binding protein YcfA (HicA-like mRNA interferase family)